jgi:hypothetical protein
MQCILRIASLLSPAADSKFRNKNLKLCDEIPSGLMVRGEAALQAPLAPKTFDRIAVSAEADAGAPNNG